MRFDDLLRDRQAQSRILAEALMRPVGVIELGNLYNPMLATLLKLGLGWSRVTPKGAHLVVRQENLPIAAWPCFVDPGNRCAALAAALN